MSSIASGACELDSDNLGDVSEFFTDEEKAEIPAKKSYKLEDYWLKTLQASEAVGSLIMPDDEPLLKKLNKVDLKLESTSDNYELTFYFDENDYITNASLNLKVEVDKDDDCSKIISEEISWKEGKCLTEKTVTKTQTNKKTKKKREVTKKQKQESFFHIFKNRSVDDEEEEEEELDDDNYGVFYDAQSIGDSLSVFKYIVSKYHGASFFGAEIPDYKFDDGFDGEGESDDDEDEEAAEAKPKKSKGHKGGKPGQEECKKQ